MAYLPVRPNLGRLLVLLLGGNGPVDEEQVHVVETELLEGALERPGDILGTVQVVPHLGADEDVLALDGGVLLEEVVEGITDLALVEVEPGTVEVTVAGLQGTHDGLVGLADGPLAGEGAEADAGDLDPIVEGEGDTGGHDCDSSDGDQWVGWRFRRGRGRRSGLEGEGVGRGGPRWLREVGMEG